MNAWKSSTLLVLAAFSVSVLLLFAKSGMVSERAARAHADANSVVVSNHIYSPAAADPDLRSPERAAKVRRRPAAKPVANRVNVPPTTRPAARPPVTKPAAAPAAAGEPAADAPPAREAAPAAPRHDVPPGHDFYVVTATFTRYENAERGLAEMKRKGCSKAWIGNFDEGKYYSVIGDTFADEPSARYLVQQLEAKHGVKAYIYHKQD